MLLVICCFNSEIPSVLLQYLNILDFLNLLFYVSFYLHPNFSFILYCVLRNLNCVHCPLCIFHLLNQKTNKQTDCQNKTGSKTANYNCCLICIDFVWRIHHLFYLGCHSGCTWKNICPCCLHFCFMFKLKRLNLLSFTKPIKDRFKP